MVTVLTPAYNRAHTLERVFNSLIEQTNKNFEWLVIDDGSTDETPLLLEKLIQKAAVHSIKVRYFFQQNGGKHVAINTGCKLAEGEWILILDSDDALTPDAIATVDKAIQTNPQTDIAGFCFRKSYFDGLIIGESRGLEPQLFLHPTKAGQILKGDLCYIFKRCALQEQAFPVISGEKFVPELYIWNKIGDMGRILFYTKKAIYLCEYLEDGYTKNFFANLKRNPKGFLLYYRAQFSREETPVRKLKCGIRSLQCLFYAFLKELKS